MKKIFFSLALLLFFLNGFAQLRLGQPSEKPRAGGKGFMIALQMPNPFNFQVEKPRAVIMGRYMLTDKLGLRLGLSYYKKQNKYEGLVDANTREIYKGDSNMANISLGIQKSFGNNTKLEPYIGLDVTYSRGQSNYSDRYELLDPSKDGFINPAYNGSFLEYKGFYGGISKIGLMPVAGVNFYFIQNFAIGGELGWGTTWGRIGKYGESTISEKNGTVEVKSTDKSTEMLIGKAMIRIGITAFF